MPNPNIAELGKPYQFQQGNPGGPGRPKISMVTEEFVERFVTGTPIPVPVLKMRAREYGLARGRVEELYSDGKHKKLLCGWRAPGGATEHFVCSRPEHCFTNRETEKRPDPISLKEFLKRLRIKADRRIVELKMDVWQAGDFWRMAPAFVKLATG